MLYNKNWDAKTVTSDPFTLENLIAWLEKQPAGQEYEWSSVDRCLLGQWSRALGADDPGTKSHTLADDPALFEVALGNICECTFGAALQRARKEAA